MSLVSDDTGPASMTWREAEHLAAEHMRALGFADAEATPLGTDQGLDVIASGGVAQVKHFSSTAVGSPDVQRLKGAGHDHSRLLFYALNGYSMAAVAYADAAGVALFAYSLASRVDPVNASARQLVQAGYVPRDFGRSTSARERVVAELSEYGQTTIDSCTRLVHAASELLSDPEWIAQLTPERFSNEVSPAVEDFVRLLEMFRGLNGSHPVGEFMSSVVACEGMAQRIAQRFGLDYEEFLPGGSARG